MEILKRHDGTLGAIYLNDTVLNWAEGEFHFWGECKTPENIRTDISRKSDGNGIIEKYTFTNAGDSDISISKGDIGIWLPFNDSYEDARTSYQKHCHVHPWCGGENSWVNAVRCDGTFPCLGLALTGGSFCTYSVERENNSNDRGDFLFLISPCIIKAHESYTLSFVLFEYSGDFFSALNKYQPVVHAEYFTFFDDEVPEIYIDSKKVMPKCTKGYHTVNYGDSFFRYQVIPKLNVLAKVRCEFIAKNQQEHGGVLDGAYLIYDNETHERVYEENPNHNAGRERIGMGLLMARYLQHNYDITLHESLKKYTDFVLREYFDEETGEVFNELHRDNHRRRIYNNAWYASFFRELYRLEKDKRWLKCMFKAFRDLYMHGGYSFYPLAMEITDSLECLKHAGMKREYDALYGMFSKNADHILKNGIDYPGFEVRFEDNIVVPAGMISCQMYMLTNDKKYLLAAEDHLRLHEAFTGFQPDARMHSASVHHWDDFWFGKRRLYGDTYPHYWITAGALLYANMGICKNDISLIQKARAAMRTSLSLFSENGQATCAIFTPYTSNGNAGDFIDPWANDQDWALYHALVFDEMCGI